MMLSKNQMIREAWTSVFTFPFCCLRQPIDRGRSRRYLTTEIKPQISDFDEGKNTAFSASSSSAKRKLHDSAAVTFDCAAAKRALAKLDEADFKGAIRQLCSTDSIVKPSVASYNALLAKHLLHQKIDVPAPRILSTSPPRVNKSGVVSNKITPPGFLRCPDDLRLQHLKDITERQIGGSLIIAFTHLVNFILGWKTPV